MYVGLIDLDMLVYPNNFTPSFELMQYSTFYKQQNNIVKMVYDINNVSNFDKIILVNYNPRIHIPKTLLSDPRVEWFGEHFYSAEIRLPKEVEKCEMDKLIYEPFILKNKNKFTAKQRDRLIMFLSSHMLPYKLTFKDEIIFDYRKVFKRKEDILLYDKNLFSCEEVTDSFLKEVENKPFYLTYSQPVYDFDTFLRIVKNINNFRFFKANRKIGCCCDLDKKTFMENYNLFENKTALGISLKKDNNETWENCYLRTFLKFINYFLYAISKGSILRCYKNFISENGEGFFEHQLLVKFYFFTNFASKNSDYSFGEYLCKNAQHLYKPLVKKYGRCSNIMRPINSNIKDVKNSGVWVI